MQFATLFLIASAVLAMPTGSASGNNAVAGLVKKSDGFVFPDDDEPTVYVPKDGVKIPEAGRMIFPDELEENYILKPKANSNSNANKNEDHAAPAPAPVAAPAPAAEVVSSVSAPVASSSAAVSTSSSAASASAGPVKNRYKNQSDKNGKLCSLYKGAITIEEIPEECLKPVFCNMMYSSDKMGCRKVNLRAETVNKEELMQQVDRIDYAQSAICRLEDLYDPNSEEEINA